MISALGGRGFTANLPTSGPPTWGDIEKLFVPVPGTSKTAGIMRPICPHLGTQDGGAI